MLNIIAVIYGRMTSSRLPGKVLKNLKGKSVLFHHLERMRQCKNVSTIYFSTSKHEMNQPIIEEAKRYNVPCYAGAEEDILERLIAIAQKEKADAVFRCGADKPLFSYEIVDHMADEYRGEDLLSISTPLGKGIGSEILSLSAMKRVHEHYHGPAISKYIYEYPHLFNTRAIEVDDEFSRPEFRTTLDTKEDYSLFKCIYDLFYEEGIPVDIREVFKYLDDHPDIANINRNVEEKMVNLYIKELVGKPVFTVFKDSKGEYFVKNRMEEVIPFVEFKDAIDNFIWNV